MISLLSLKVINKGFPVGISNLDILFSPSLNKNLHIALKELPCAEISIFLLSSNLLSISFLK